MKLLHDHIQRQENEIAWRQSFIDEVFKIVHFAEKPFKTTKQYKKLREICLRYGIEEIK